ncbi:MAG TPA: sigma-70 family RNA polymerase sigma factor [Pseudonocardiaceae bacterium]|nr:sigma-70 family RNA polymerase sigma factor [Pseudonocardiaceae bacterium]
MTTSVDVDLALARDGDDGAFTRLVAPLRKELHAHCYRMLGSAYDADDALQDALVRAWRGLSGFEGRSSLRSWLYTVATRTCLDQIDLRGRRATPMDLGPASEYALMDNPFRNEIAWLGPYPETGLSGRATPEAHYEQREAVEIAFVAALQHLPGNQRAALVLFEVLGFAVAEIAEMMATSTASVNSALQRARRIIAEKIPPHSQQQTLREVEDVKVREIVASFSAALERGDADALLALLTEDVTWSMPPMAHWYAGIDATMDFATRVPLGGCGTWRHRPVTVNGQPAAAAYLRPYGETGPHRAFGVNVLTLRDGKIADVIAFIGNEHFELVGLPLFVD